MKSGDSVMEKNLKCSRFVLVSAVTEPFLSMGGWDTFENRIAVKIFYIVTGSKIKLFVFLVFQTCTPKLNLLGTNKQNYSTFGISYPIKNIVPYVCYGLLSTLYPGPEL